MDRPQLKLEMRRMLNSHFPFFILLFLPVLVIEFGLNFIQYLPWSHGSSYLNIGNYWNAPSIYDSRFNFDYTDPKAITAFLGLLLLLAIISSLLLTGIQFASIDLIRNKTTFDQPVNKSFTIFNNGDYFIGTIMIGLITSILTFLWSLLLFIPGIIKGYAYSQAIFIYRDALDKGEKIGYLEAITKSRELMDGNKMDFFVLYLSFLGWFILSNFTLNILDLWVVPYYNLAVANFYVKIHDDQSEPLQTILADPDQPHHSDDDHSSSNDQK
ncbi:DUF975 family protein [Lentilactobacillus hilgardii]|uniref:DUF975 family protein n=1 Tax=Lentilactobacillus hilgardii TaxID=1588 RepID=UPI003FA5BD5C